MIKSASKTTKELQQKHINELQQTLEGLHKAIKDTDVLLSAMHQNGESDTDEFQAVLDFNDNASKAYHNIETAVKFLK